MQGSEPKSRVQVAWWTVVAATAAAWLATGPWVAAQFDAGIDAERSVVKITGSLGADTHQGTGFIWHDSDHAVTALHVVAGTSGIQVYSDALKNGVPAVVEATNFEADLALLRLTGAAKLGLKALIVAEPRPAVPYEVFGFPLDVPKPFPTEIKLVLRGPDTFASLFSKTNFERMTGTQPYPNFSAQILRANGGMTHGYSGAPILDGTGRVVGIADGGLKPGLAPGNWAIAAAPYLLKTAAGGADFKASFPNSSQAPRATASEFITMTIPTVVIGPATGAGRSAAPPAAGRGAPTAAGRTAPPAAARVNPIPPGLRLVWSSSLKAILDTLPEHDENELAYDDFEDLIETIGEGPLRNVKIDVYEDRDTGATIAVPHEMTFSYDQNENRFYARSKNGRVDMLVQVYDGDDDKDARQARARFDSMIEGRAKWQPLPNEKDEKFREGKTEYLNKTREATDRAGKSLLMDATLILDDSDFLGTAVFLGDVAASSDQDEQLFYISWACVKLADFGDDEDN